jgi:hypothetical protein
MITNMPNDFLSDWYLKGSEMIFCNFATFKTLVAQAKHAFSCEDMASAAVYCEIAAKFNVIHHSGLFVSHDLERLLAQIARGGATNGKHCNERVGTRRFERVLHVASHVVPVGGAPNFIRRYIRQDAGRLHSLALTRQLAIEVPRSISSAVRESGGCIYKLNNRIGGLPSWSVRLRTLARDYDIVVLHKHDEDVIPNIAFSGDQARPPVLLINHNDHQFWVGAHIADMVVNLRDSGRRLSHDRRNISPERNALLPTLIELRERTISSHEAKAQLGLSGNSIVLLSMARKVKYTTVMEDNFAETHVPLLVEYPNLNLIVVGAGRQNEWNEANRRTNGRIITVPETPHTDLYFQAADIFVDTFPFVSITSLIEAGCYGLPLVTRFPYSEESEILGADLPGLTGNLMRARNMDDYLDTLRSLVKSEAYRKEVGDRTRSKIITNHTGSGWSVALDAIYDKARHIGRIDGGVQHEDRMFVGEPDVFIPFVYRHPWDMECVVRDHLRLMPFRVRLRQLRGLHKKSGRYGIVPYLLPEFFLCLSRPLWKGRYQRQAEKWSGHCVEE